MIRSYFSVILIAFILLFVLKGTLGNNNLVMNKPPFETSMERGRFSQVLSIYTYHSFFLDHFQKYLRPDIAWYSGHYFSAFPPGVALLAVPAYAIGSMVNLGQVFTTLSTVLFTILTALLIINACRQLGISERGATFSAIAYSLGSAVFPYSVSFSAHPVSACITMLLLLQFINILHRKQLWKSYFWICFLYGLNVFIDYPNLGIHLPVIIAAVILGTRKISHITHVEIYIPTKIVATMTLGILAMLIPFIVFNYTYFQKPIVFTNTYNLKRLEIQGVHYTEKNLSNNLFKTKSYASRFQLKSLLKGIHTLLVSHDRGLFTFSPIFIAALFGIVVFFRKNKILTILMVSIFIMNLLVYGSFDDPWGGWAFGPRYLIVSLPILAIFIAKAYDEYASHNPTIKFIFYFLLIISMGINLVGALTTNTVPTRIEALSLNQKDNVFYNIEYLRKTGTSSFLYHQFLAQHMTPISFGILICVISAIGVLILV